MTRRVPVCVKKEVPVKVTRCVPKIVRKKVPVQVCRLVPECVCVEHNPCQPCGLGLLDALHGLLHAGCAGLAEGHAGCCGK